MAHGSFPGPQPISYSPWSTWADPWLEAKQQHRFLCMFPVCMPLPAEGDQDARTFARLLWPKGSVLQGTSGSKIAGRSNRKKRRREQRVLASGRQPTPQAVPLGSVTSNRTSARTVSKSAQIARLARHTHMRTSPHIVTSFTPPGFGTSISERKMAGRNVFFADPLTGKAQIQPASISLVSTLQDDMHFSTSLLVHLANTRPSKTQVRLFPDALFPDLDPKSRILTVLDIGGRPDPAGFFGGGNPSRTNPQFYEGIAVSVHKLTNPFITSIQFSAYSYAGADLLVTTLELRPAGSAFSGYSYEILESPKDPNGPTRFPYPAKDGYTPDAGVSEDAAYTLQDIMLETYQNYPNFFQSAPAPQGTISQLKDDRAADAAFALERQDQIDKVMQKVANGATAPGILRPLLTPNLAVEEEPTPPAVSTAESETDEAVAGRVAADQERLGLDPESGTEEGIRLLDTDGDGIADRYAEYDAEGNLINRGDVPEYLESTPGLFDAETGDPIGEEASPENPAVDLALLDPDPDQVSQAGEYTVDTDGDGVDDLRLTADEDGNIIGEEPVGTPPGPPPGIPPEEVDLDTVSISEGAPLTEEEIAEMDIPVPLDSGAEGPSDEAPDEIFGEEDAGDLGSLIDPDPDLDAVIDDIFAEEDTDEEVMEFESPVSTTPAAGSQAEALEDLIGEGISEEDARAALGMPPAGGAPPAPPPPSADDEEVMEFESVITLNEPGTSTDEPLEEIFAEEDTDEEVMEFESVITLNEPTSSTDEPDDEEFEESFEEDDDAPPASPEVSSEAVDHPVLDDDDMDFEGIEDPLEEAPESPSHGRVDDGTDLSDILIEDDDETDYSNITIEEDTEAEVRDTDGATAEPLADPFEGQTTEEVVSDEMVESLAENLGFFDPNDPNSELSDTERQFARDQLEGHVQERRDAAEGGETLEQVRQRQGDELLEEFHSDVEETNDRLDRGEGALGDDPFGELDLESLARESETLPENGHEPVQPEIIEDVLVVDETSTAAPPAVEGGVTQEMVDAMTASTPGLGDAAARDLLEQGIQQRQEAADLGETWQENQDRRGEELLEDVRPDRSTDSDPFSDLDDFFSDPAPANVPISTDPAYTSSANQPFSGAGPGSITQLGGADIGQPTLEQLQNLQGGYVHLDEAGNPDVIYSSWQSQASQLAVNVNVATTNQISQDLGVNVHSNLHSWYQTPEGETWHVGVANIQQDTSGQQLPQPPFTPPGVNYATED